MFGELNEKNVQLMLSLSRENLKDPESLKEQLSITNMLELFELCKAHELDGVVASHILQNQLCALPEFWLEAYQFEKQHLDFLKQKAVEICSVMQANGIRMVVLKNGGIMADMVEDPAACPMEDIDSLVKKSDFKHAHQILLDHGLTFKFRSEFEKEELESAYRDGSTEYCISMPDGGEMWFELAWRAVAGRWIRRDLEPDSDRLIDECYCADGTAVGILSPEDNLLQVSAHTAKHSYLRAPGLRLHLDVERIVAHKKIDWQLFLDKVKSAHIKTSTYFSLYLAKMLFETPIPQYVLDELKPSERKTKRILSLLSKAGMLYPKKPKFTKLQFLSFQTSLYDHISDMWYVLKPKNKGLQEIYGYKCALLTPFYMFVRLLDLVGIRKKKK